MTEERKKNIIGKVDPGAFKPPMPKPAANAPMKPMERGPMAKKPFGPMEQAPNSSAGR